MSKIIETLLEIPEETQTIEFKRLNGDKVVSKILETVVAFANTDGGNIVLGIDDPEKTKLKGLDRIYGIEENKELCDEVIHKAQGITPPLVTTQTTIAVRKTNKTVVIIDVPKSVTGFHSISNQVFVRLNKSNKKLSPDEIIKMNYAKGFKKADKELVEVDFDLLNTQYFNGWKTVRRLTGSIKEILAKTGLARKWRGGCCQLVLRFYCSQSIQQI